MFDEKKTGVLSNATKKWGDPLQRPHGLSLPNR